MSQEHERCFNSENERFLMEIVTNDRFLCKQSAIGLENQRAIFYRDNSWNLGRCSWINWRSDQNPRYAIGIHSSSMNQTL